ncbi:unnamed protein product, partial [Meganyctiphanes norvegica]
MASFDDDYSWSPPSEAEQKVIEARRERNNKISSIMGQYLLKGYKMLAITCPTCDLVILGDKQLRKVRSPYSDIDQSRNNMKSPVSEEAARKTIEETHHRNPVQQDKPINSVGDISQGFTLPTVQQKPSGSSQSNNNSIYQAQNNYYDNRPATSNLGNGVSADSEDNISVKSLKFNCSELQVDLNSALSAVRDKMVWATQQLQSSSSVENSQQLIGLITESCKAITALQHLTTTK